MESPLRRVREELRLSGVELAAAAGVSPCRVSLAERGNSSIPVQVMAALQRVGVPVEDLRREHERYVIARGEEILQRAADRRGQVPAGTRMLAAACNKGLDR